MHVKALPNAQLLSQVNQCPLRVPRQPFIHNVEMKYRVRYEVQGQCTGS